MFIRCILYQLFKISITESNVSFKSRWRGYDPQYLGLLQLIRGLVEASQDCHNHGNMALSQGGKLLKMLAMYWRSRHLIKNTIKLEVGDEGGIGMSFRVLELQFCPWPWRFTILTNQAFTQTHYVWVLVSLLFIFLLSADRHTSTVRNMMNAILFVDPVLPVTNAFYMLSLSDLKDLNWIWI